MITILMWLFMTSIKAAYKSLCYELTTLCPVIKGHLMTSWTTL